MKKSLLDLNKEDKKSIKEFLELNKLTIDDVNPQGYQLRGGLRIPPVPMRETEWQCPDTHTVPCRYPQTIDGGSCIC